YMAVYVKMFSATFFFIVFYLMLFFVQPIYNLLIEYNYQQYAFDTIKTLTILAILGILLFCIGNCFFANKKITLNKVFLEQTVVKKVIILISFITLVSIFLCFFYAGKIGRASCRERG